MFRKNQAEQSGGTKPYRLTMFETIKHIHTIKDTIKPDSARQENCDYAFVEAQNQLRSKNQEQKYLR